MFASVDPSDLLLSYSSTRVLVVAVVLLIAGVMNFLVLVGFAHFLIVFVF